jgi:hypothetical protein
MVRESVGEPGTLVGQIVESGTNVPIHHAWVQVDDDTAGQVFTDGGGQFRVAQVDPGRHVLTVAFIGFGRVRGQFSMPRTQGLKLRVALRPVSVHACGGFAVPVAR